jgi:hypothetical protein
MTGCWELGQNEVDAFSEAYQRRIRYGVVEKGLASENLGTRFGRDASMRQRSVLGLRRRVLTGRCDRDVGFIWGAICRFNGMSDESCVYDGTGGGSV